MSYHKVSRLQLFSINKTNNWQKIRLQNTQIISVKYTTRSQNDVKISQYKRKKYAFSIPANRQFSTRQNTREKLIQNTDVLLSTFPAATKQFRPDIHIN